MKKNLFLFSFLLISFGIFAQSLQPMMSFEKTVHNFGNINEDGGNVTYKFEFTNTGAEPVIITNVEASCGCTTPEWSKQPVQPGASGSITVSYNPLGRPGGFEKDVTITSNAQNSPLVLKIGGSVIQKKADPGEGFNVIFGELRVKANNILFENIYNDEVQKKELEIYNPTDKPLNVSYDAKQNPQHLKIEAVPPILEPKQKGKLIVTFDAKLKNDWDFVYDAAMISINGIPVNNMRINVSANIKEKFSEKAIANPPAFTLLDEETFKFDTINEGQEVSHTYNFKNTGKSDLIIRKTRTSCGCTAINPKETIIKPGKTSSITVVFNSTGKPGNQMKSVTVITNIPDEKKNKIYLKMEGMVLKKN